MKKSISKKSKPAKKSKIVKSKTSTMKKKPMDNMMIKILTLVVVLAVIGISAWFIRDYLNKPKDEEKDEENEPSPSPSPNPVENQKAVSPDDFCVSRSCVPSEIYDANEPVPLTGVKTGLNDVLMRKVKTMGALQASTNGTPGSITVNSNFGLTDNHVQELINTAHSLTNVPKNKILLDYSVDNKLGHLRIVKLPDTVYRFSGKTKPVDPNVIIAYGKQEGLDCPICNV